jgi:hypothetical protein
MLEMTDYQALPAKLIIHLSWLWKYLLRKGAGLRG